MSPLAFDIALAAIGGLCLGSFLNVVAYRLPAGLSLVTPGSACPGCGAAIRPYDNLPVVSWLVLGGHCRACDTSISPRYPLTEALTGALFAAVVIAKGASASIWLDLIFVAGARRDHPDRPRAPDHPQPHRGAARAGRRGADGRL